jgi:hypothetical protein
MKIEDPLMFQYIIKAMYTNSLFCTTSLSMLASAGFFHFNKTCSGIFCFRDLANVMGL